MGVTYFRKSRKAEVQVPFTRFRAAGPALSAVWAAAGAILLLLIAPAPARAVPAFAVQTGEACQKCHVGGFGPQLTAFGRDFKLHGYTLGDDKFNVPLSAMAVASYIRTTKAQAEAPAPHYATNDNVALDQVSGFLAGGIGEHFGGFAQFTYDGVGRAWAWDNLDLRLVTTLPVSSHEVLAGLSLNNSPGVQDPWNTLPAWSFPYTDSALAPGPAAAPLLAGGLAQNVLGLTAYAWIDKTVLVEGGGYGSPGASALTRLGADPFSPGDIAGTAPYGRAALQHALQGGVLEVGAFGLRADIHPARDRSAGTTDRYSDWGLDASYQLDRRNGDVFSLNGRYLHEDQRLSASCVLAEADGCDARLTDLRADASYYWGGKFGVTFAVFDTTGSSNPFLYPDSRTFSPDSSGVELQVDHTFFGKTSPLGPRFNLRVGVQYTAYAKFDGARKNYDGAGTNASDNDTLRVFTWLAY